MITIAIQILREKNLKERIAKVKIEDGENISLEKTRVTVKRAASYLSALQTSDGHWPAHLAGSLFFTPALVTSTFYFFFITFLFYNYYILFFKMTYNFEREKKVIKDKENDECITGIHKLMSSKFKEIY